MSKDCKTIYPKLYDLLKVIHLLQSTYKFDRKEYIQTSKIEYKIVVTIIHAHKINETYFM